MAMGCPIMKFRHGINLTWRACGFAVGLALLAGCSSSFGGGSDPSQPNAVVVPPGAKVVCQDGSTPPCY